MGYRPGRLRWVHFAELFLKVHTMSIHINRLLPAVFIFLFSLLACQREVDKPIDISVTETVVDVGNVPGDIPTGQLAAGVSPVAYQLILTIVNKTDMKEIEGVPVRALVRALSLAD